jgi:excisionase family DNA binding protein
MDTDKHRSQLLTVPEVAERLRLSRGTVYKLIRSGVVPAVQFGRAGSWRVMEDRLERTLRGGEGER